MDATNHKTNQREKQSNGSNDQIHGGRQVSPSLLHQLLWTKLGCHLHSLRHQAVDPRRRLPSPSFALFTPSRRWSRRSVDTVMPRREKAGITRHRLEIGELLDESEGSFVFEGIVEECMGLEGVRLDRKISKSDWSVTTSAKSSVGGCLCSFKLGVDARLWQSVIVFPSLLHISELVKQIKWLQRSEPSRTTNLTIPLCRFLWRRFDSTLTPPTLDDGSETCLYIVTVVRALVTLLSLESASSGHPTLMLCVGTSCLIIQLSHCKRVPDIIPRFLTDPNTTFVGIRNCQDAKRLARTRHQLEIGELLDARMYVVDSQGRSLRVVRLRRLLRMYGFRGVKLDRGISRSDWSVEYLSNDQILQVSVDAYVCFKLDVSARLCKLNFKRCIEVTNVLYRDLSSL
ncbi:hypothetical protein HID58_004021 [Brassica napus]|uniref:3'-5' exonuclease domain-containing protein n=1 Tax=Brassica napus TaxID=3708 RepID=A0ABQ7XIC0_BRANA|nr:hypothetical protein HID58_004021 [Brassica napus]